MEDNKIIGVLSFQGSVEEHLAALEELPGVTGVPVKTREVLKQVDGLILPGGESTTIGKLLGIFGLLEPLRQRILQGMPVWGTCAGMILLAKDVVGEAPHLGVMDISVRRNAYGTQLDSFQATAPVSEISDAPIPLVFIRAPWVERAWGSAKPLLTLDGHIVAVRQDNMLATSFHPELTGDRSVYRYFRNMIG